MALNTKAVPLAVIIKVGKQHERSDATISVVKRVMAVGTLSLVIGIRMIRIWYYV
jgi:hypothetical protein